MSSKRASRGWRFTRIAVTTVCGISLLASAACGNSASAGDVVGQTNGKDHLDVLLGSVFYEAAYVAQEQGLFEAENLDVNLIEGGNAAEQIPQLMSGQADIAITGGVSLIQAVDRGLDVKMVLSQQNSYKGVLTTGLLAPKDSPVANYSDLGGKTIGLQALQDTTHLGTLMAAKQAGVDPASMKFVQLPLPSINEAVQKGTVDVGYPLSIFYAQGVKSGLRELGSPTSDALENGPNVVWAAKGSFIEKNAGVLERFTAAMTKATELAMADDQLIRSVQKAKTQLPPDYIDTAVIVPLDTSINRDGVQRTLDGMFEFDFITRELTFDDVVAGIAPVED